MTAPDRITLQYDSSGITISRHGSEEPNPRFKAEYIRRAPEVLAADETVQAMIAAAYEAAAKACDNPPRDSATPYRDDGTWSKNDKCQHGMWHYEDCAMCSGDAIRALMPADAASALARLLAEARVAALEEAAEVARSMDGYDGGSIAVEILRMKGATP